MALWTKAVFLIIGTIVIFWFSRTSILKWRSHGFYRFWAWELILLLFLFNIEFWFRDPLSVHQLIAWLLLIVSLVFVIWGVHMMRRIGKPDDSRREDTALLGIEKTTHLVTTGIFKYIRNPLYSSLLFLNWGIFFKHPSWVSLCLAFAATLSLFITAKIEEKENLQYFGNPYLVYKKTSKIFIPFIW